MQTETHLDWFECTVPRSRREAGVTWPENWTKKGVETKPLNGYNHATLYADGRQEMFHDTQQSMGLHVLITGKPLSILCPTQESELEMIEHFQSIGGKVTRIDCAIDVMDFPLDFKELYKLIEAKEYECRLRKEPIYDHSPTEGDTIYFGKFKSSVFTRIYDKGKEQKVDKEWVRIETVFRHSRANSAATAYRTGGTIAGLSAGHVRIPKSQWWTEVMTSEPVKTRLNRIDGDKRMEWLLKSVAPTLAKEISLHGDDVWNKFRDAVWEKVSLGELTD